MVCIYCSGPTKVTNSRPQKRLRQTWRRHACQSCGAIFTSIEGVDLGTSLVVHRTNSTDTYATGVLRPFSRDKLFVSILRAVGHRKTPIDDAGALSATIIAKLLRSAPTAVISPADITITALQVLKNFDKAAAVQYQAYHQG